jgi:hypothetical protein
MNAAQVRELLSRKDPSEYNLIDVHLERLAGLLDRKL